MIIKGKNKERKARLVTTNKGKEKILVKFPYGPKFQDDLSMVREFDNRKFEKAGGEKYWLTDISLSNLQKLIENGFEMEDDLKEKARSFYVNWNQISNETVGDKFLDKRLRGFQKEAINFVMQNIGKGLIALPQGGGKTIVSLGFMRLRPNWSPVLIIVRASLKINWLREAKKWLENPDVEIIGGTTPYKTTGSIVIANYDILSPRYNWVTNEQGERKRVLQPGTGWIEELQRRNFQLAILDESTAIKNHKSNRTKATEKIVKNVPGKILLTGTPIENRPAEIYTSIRMINKQLFPSKINFDIRFCAGHDDGYRWNNKGASNTKVLHNILSNTLMFRRKKAEIMPELPPKTRSFIPVEIDNMQEYKSAERDFINYVKEKGKPSASHLAMINELKQLAVKGKMPVIVQWIKEMLDVNDKLVVFMHHKFVSRQLLKEFKGQALKIDGDISTNMRKDGTSPRQDVIDRFENDPKIQLLVANYEAGGYGLNLQFASEGGHLELMWNSSIHEQAIDRMHRMTQKDTVNEYFMIALDTIEETIADIIDTKSDVSGQIVDGEELQQENMLKKLIDKYREEE